MEATGVDTATLRFTIHTKQVTTFHAIHSETTCQDRYERYQYKFTIGSWEVAYTMAAKFKIL